MVKTLQSSTCTCLVFSCSEELWNAATAYSKQLAEAVVATLQPIPLYRSFHHVSSLDRHFCGSFNLTDEMILFSLFYWCSLKVEQFHSFELVLPLGTAHFISPVWWILLHTSWDLPCCQLLSSAQCNAADQDFILQLTHSCGVEKSCYLAVTWQSLLLQGCLWAVGLVQWDLCSYVLVGCCFSCKRAES